MKKSHHQHQHEREARRSSQAESQEAVDAAIKFSRNSEAVWDELLADTPGADCQKRQACVHSNG
jgi:hypothetical protein